MTSSNVKQAMKDAIIRLLHKQNFLKITVTDLIKEAGVSRASFYRMYRTVDEVVDDVMEDVKNSFRVNIVPVLFSDDEQAIKAVMKEFFIRVQKNDIPLIKILPENIPFLFSKLERNAVLNKDQKFDNLDAKFRLGLYIFNAIMMSRLWAYYGYKESVDELVDYIYRGIYNK